MIYKPTRLILLPLVIITFFYYHFKSFKFFPRTLWRKREKIFEWAIFLQSFKCFSFFFHSFCFRCWSILLSSSISLCVSFVFYSVSNFLFGCFSSSSKSLSAVSLIVYSGSKPRHEDANRTQAPNRRCCILRGANIHDICGNIVNNNDEFQWTNKNISL